MKNNFKGVCIPSHATCLHIQQFHKHSFPFSSRNRNEPLQGLVKVGISWYSTLSRDLWPCLIHYIISSEHYSWFALLDCHKHSHTFGVANWTRQAWMASQMELVILVSQRPLLPAILNWLKKLISITMSKYNWTTKLHATVLHGLPKNYRVEWEIHFLIFFLHEYIYTS